MEKEHKVITAFEASTVRELVDIANEYELTREDIIQILSTESGYIMICQY